MKTDLNEETVTFTIKGEIVIPRKLREEFEIKEGTKATVIATPEGILLKPITRSYIHSLRGSLKSKGALKALIEDKRPS